MNRWRTRLQLILLALLVLLLGLAPYPHAFPTAMRQAEAHRTAREYSAALAVYQQAASHDPESPLPSLRMGEVYLLQHRFVEATVAFSEAQRRDGGQGALLGLGESYAGRGDWAAAIQSWLQALALNPGDARVHVALGRGNIDQGSFEQAVRYLVRALNLQPAGGEAATAHALLGRLMIGDEPDEAANHFRQAGDEDMLAVLEVVSDEPNPARRLLLLGLAFLQRGELALARHYTDRALALAPQDAEALAYKAHILDQLGETVAAGRLLEQALDLDDESPVVYYFLGTHHRLVGNVEAAQAALWEALLLDPENAAFRAEMAAAFVDQPDYPMAEEWYRGAVDAAPQDIDFHLMLVQFYLRHLYRVEETGLPAAQMLVDLAPDDPRALDLLGWAYHLAGRHSEGQQALQQALARAPDLVSAHYHLGSLYATIGQLDLARQHLLRAADLDTGGFYRGRAELVLKGLESKGQTRFR